nr:AAA domain-containing protein [Pseudenhygromyxa sp. WMMC2535]
MFFHATAGHPKVADALARQTWRTLRPFENFLRQAIHTAKKRQFRYQLPWERVRNLVTIGLEPLDTRLRVPRRQPGVLLAGWPEDLEPDRNQFAFVVNRGVPVQVDTVSRSSGGLVIETSPPVETGDRLMWCGRESTVELEAQAAPPRQVVDLNGRPITLRADPSPEGDRHWTLVIEGARDDCDLYVDGEEVEADVMPPFQGLRRVRDADGRSFEVAGSVMRVEDPPADGPLLGDNGLRYRWHYRGKKGRSGNWVRLLPPDESDSEEFIDPRAAFCEGDVREVWTQARHRKDTIYKVRRVDADRYQLRLDRLPPDDSKLYLPVDLRNLYLQQRALKQLANAPLPHHQGLLRLCEDPKHTRWPDVRPVRIGDDNWRALTDETRSGTPEQRRFVERALGTPDFAFLEGPPGSGKTTAICEIVQQLVEDGQRVLLCASTHVAIDNVLERLLDTESPIDAVRIGRLDRVDDNVQRTQLDTKVSALVDQWRRLPSMAKCGDDELQQMAERVVVMAANLTCGTTMGIVNHPLFRGRDEDLNIWDRPISTMPHWDVLIVDEASKTLIQEFLVPALMAKRRMVVGDVRQLPPFADRADIVANLRDLVDEKDRPVFPRDHQRACLLLFRLLRPPVRQQGLRWLLVEPPGVLNWIEKELASEPPSGEFTVVRVVGRRHRSHGPVQLVTVDDLEGGHPDALHLAAADWVMVGNDIFDRVARHLPGNLVAAGHFLDAETHALACRHSHWLNRAGRLPQPYKDKRFRRDGIETFEQSQQCEAAWLSRNDLGQELAWRITRIHELRQSRSDRERKRLKRDLSRLVPYAVDISEQLAEIEDIGLPSILEVLQEGIGTERTNRPSALTAGFRTSRPQEFAERFESLTYQHRMHPDIAAFSREVIYGGEALKDANTIALRDDTIGWDFGRFRSRRAWASVAGRETNGENQDEINVIASLVREFVKWAKRTGPPRRGSPGVWEVACLSFYVKQERALSRMLQQVTGDDRNTRFSAGDGLVEIVCGTVDRFQGREADLVMISMRNIGRVGFLDSPNRLNVAITRARQQLVVVGNADYFGRCGINELQELARRTPRVADGVVRKWRRGEA